MTNNLYAEMLQQVRGGADAAAAGEAARGPGAWTITATPAADNDAAPPPAPVPVPAAVGAVAGADAPFVSMEQRAAAAAAAAAVVVGSGAPLAARHAGTTAGAADRSDPVKELKKRVKEKLQAKMGARMTDDSVTDEELHIQVGDQMRALLAAEQTALTATEREALAAELVAETIGLGPLERLLADDDISEVMVNGPDRVYVEYKGKLTLSSTTFEDETQLRETIDRIVAKIGRRVDESSPMVDARLKDGSRVNAVIPPLAVSGSTLTIRKFRKEPLRVADLIRYGSMSQELADFLEACVKGRLNVVVSGGTGSGKALDVDTPVPTPTGFVRMGDLNVGDTVFDETGNPCTVEGVFDQPSGRECFEVVFSDGTTIVADADHNWLTHTRRERISASRAQLREARPEYGRWSSDEVRHFDAAVAAMPEVVTLRQFHAALNWSQGRMAAIRRKANSISPVSTIRKGPRGNVLVRQYVKGELAGAVSAVATANDQSAHRLMPKVRTTREIAESLFDGSYLNHSVDVVSQPVSYPTATQEIDPYTFGSWLGDGTSASARFTVGVMDHPHLLDHLVGVFGQKRVTTRMRTSVHGYKTWSITVKGIMRALRDLEVLGDKHIPDNYMFGDEQQRRALLAGLLDTDGGMAGPDVCYYSSNKRLAVQVRSLIASLGYQPRIRSKVPTCNGKEGKVAYTVAFSTTDEVFRLQRKMDAHRAARSNGQGQRLSRRFIAEVRPVPSREVRCITVNSPSHLFLAGDQYVPTHNTTLLNVLSSFIPSNERIITVEDAVELQLQQDHVVQLETKAANTEGRGEVTIRDLIKNTLRMRPDRIVVGEVRAGEALDMLQAMNTGHDGALSTVHANSARDCISRLETLVMMAGMDLPHRAIREQIASAVDMIVQIGRLKDGSRRVIQVAEVERMEGDVVTMQDIFRFNYDAGFDEHGKYVGGVEPTGVRPRFMEKLHDHGIELPSTVFGAHHAMPSW